MACAVVVMLSVLCVSGCAAATRGVAEVNPSLTAHQRQINGRVLQFRPVVSEVAATPETAPITTSGVPATAAPSAFSVDVGNPASPCWGLAAGQADLPPLDRQQQAAEIAQCVDLRQSTDATAQTTALVNLHCGSGYTDILLGHDNPRLPLVACDQNGQAKYVLGSALLNGSTIIDVSAGLDRNGTGFDVNLTLDAAGSSTWAKYTAANVGKQVAFVLDSQVVSAPTIQGAIPGGQTQITGNFTQRQAEDLANTLSGR